MGILADGVWKDEWGKSMETSEPYQPKQFDLNRLHGISDQTLEMHFKLYEGYVKETNRLTEKNLGVSERWACRSGGDAGIFGTHPPSWF